MATRYEGQIQRLRQERQAASRRWEGRLERAVAQVEFAHRLRSLHPDQAPSWEEAILEASRRLDEGLRSGQVDLDGIAGAVEEALAPVGDTARQYTLLLVSHAHIDMNWMWSWPETAAVTNDTFDTMLKLLDEFPAFIFSQSQAAVYRLVERYNPAAFERIRQHVKSGRWEVTASQWVEGDKNMSSGESITRHLLYTREFCADRFGLSPEDVTVDFEPDTFGHPATLPTILARGGIRYYYHCRGSRGPSLYWWVGPDGSRLLTHCGAPWYMGALEPKAAHPLIPFARETGLKDMLVMYGVGDHGGGPTRRDLRQFEEMSRWPVFPRLEMGTLHEFFRRAEARAEGLPEVAGERNFVFTGCYTSQARQKWANRHGESLLYTAEAAALIGARAAGVDYPAAQLDEAWRDLLFSQFHDILPGSGVRDTRHYTLGKAQEVQAAAGMARTNALRALALRVGTASLLRQLPGGAGPRLAEQESGRSGGAGVGCGTGSGGESGFSMNRTAERAFLVFNPLPTAREEVVEAKLWDTQLDADRLAVTADGVEPRRVQVLERGTFWGHEFVTIAFPVRVPAFGYRAVLVSDAAAELGLLAEGDLVEHAAWAGVGGSWRQIQPAEECLENEWVRAVLDPQSGGLASLVDRRSGRQWVAAGERCGSLEYCVEENAGMTAWVLGRFLRREPLREGGRLQRLHNGPWLNTYRWEAPVGQRSRAKLDISVRHGEPRVDYRLTVDWREMGDARTGIPHLRASFPFALREAQARYEIPFGAVARQERRGEEVPAQRWADVTGEGGAGVLLVNSSKYGHRLEGQTLGLTLLRASIDPDPLPDLGDHAIAYGLVPHGDDWRVSDAVAEGERFNLPLVVSSCDLQEGDQPLAHSFLQLQGNGVRLVAAKRSQDGGGTVLRLVEVDGEDARARLEVDARLFPGGLAAAEVDPTERPLVDGEVDVEESAEGAVVTLEIPAGSVTAVRLGGGRG